LRTRLRYSDSICECPKLLQIGVDGRLKVIARLIEKAFLRRNYAQAISVKLKRDLMGDPEPVFQLLECAEQFIARLSLEAVGSKQDVGVWGYQACPECGCDHFGVRCVVGGELVTQACHATHFIDHGQVREYQASVR
jgi:hypothetical protein